MDRIFEILERKEQQATFFVLGWIARKFPEVIRKIDSMNFEIGTHSDMHQLVYEQDEATFVKDMENSIKTLEDVTGKPIRYYRAPGFSIKQENSWAFERIIDFGIEIDCSIFPAKRAHGGFDNYGHSKYSIINIGDKKLKELPINLFSLFGKKIIFSGGGYFRLLPYPVIKMMMSKSDYVMTYFHPRDFDTMQPLIKELSIARKFKSYYGISSAFQKLERLITDFDFVDIEQADNLIDWDNCKQIRF